jgi:hypothetical protein
MAKQASDYKKMVVLAASLAPLVGGAIVYYSLRKSHGTLAKLGNKTSWLAAGIWIAASIGFGLAGISVPKYIIGLLFWAGTILAIVTVHGIKKMPLEDASLAVNTQFTIGMNQLEKLAEMKERGLLTQEEFDRKKKELLGSN